MKGWIAGTGFYVGVAVRRRLRQTWAVHLSMACLGAFVSTVIGLRAVLERQAAERLLSHLAPDIGRATTWLVALGAVVVLVQGYLLVQRVTATRAPEFHTLLWIGVPRVAILTVVALEHAAHALLGGFAGTILGLGLCLGLGPITGLAAPPWTDLGRAALGGLLLPLVGLVPGGVVAVHHLTRQGWRDEDG